MVKVRYLTQAQANILLDRLPAHQREVVLFALATRLPGAIPMCYRTRDGAEVMSLPSAIAASTG